MDDFNAKNARVRITWVDEDTGERQWMEWVSVDLSLRSRVIFAQSIRPPYKEILFTPTEELQPATTLEARLALAVLDGDTDAVWPLIDDLLERRDRPADFLSREELTRLLAKVEWVASGFHKFCPCCRMQPRGHAPDCALAKALKREP